MSIAEWKARGPDAPGGGGGVMVVFGRKYTQTDTNYFWNPSQNKSHQIAKIIQLNCSNLLNRFLANFLSNKAGLFSPELLHQSTVGQLDSVYASHAMRF